MKTFDKASGSLCPMKTLTGISPFDPEILSQPESFWATLRETSPVYEVSIPGAETRVFFITRHRDIDQICKQPEIFSSQAHPSIFRWPDQPPEFDAVFEGQKFASTFTTSDPPEHRQYRRVADTGLGFREVKKWQPRIQEIVDTLIERLPREEAFDFVKDYSVLLPSEAIRIILGLPEGDARFLVWFVDEYMAMLDPSTPMDIAIERAKGVKKARDYIIPRIKGYRERPGRTSSVLSPMPAVMTANSCPWKKPYLWRS